MENSLPKQSKQQNSKPAQQHKVVSASFPLHQLISEDAIYPTALQQTPDREQPPTISAIGNLNILQNQKLAIFCSSKCPGNLILQTYDMVQVLRASGTTVLGGFQSPMEKECFPLLLRGTQPVIYCPARSLNNIRLQPSWKDAVASQRLLLPSPFQTHQHRATAALATIRNQFVSTLADIILIIHAEPGSKTEAIALQALSKNKPLLTLDSSDNQNLIEAGAKPVSDKDLSNLENAF